MANLKSIKDRITSIKNTQKITKAMKMVAAAKVKKAENTVKSSRPFTIELYKMFNYVHNVALKNEIEKIRTQNSIENYPALLEEREVKRAALVVISSNKGLAGAYCANIIRHTTEIIKKYRLKGIDVDIYLVGQKAYAPIKAIQKQYDFKIKESYVDILDNINSSSAYAIASKLADEYTNKNIDCIELITTRYKNMMTYKTENWKLLPALSNDEVQEFRNKELDKELNIEHSQHKIEPLSEFIPDVKEVLSTIVPMYITNVIYQALLEATASELASRMTAMSAATNNAQDMITHLTIDYNKARQAGITNEITEVISGANSV